MKKQPDPKPGDGGHPPGIRIKMIATCAFLSSLACALSMTGRASAQAEDTQRLAPPASAARAEAKAPPRLEERTAFTIDKGDLKLGLLAVEYGFTDNFAVGVDPPAWAARAVLPIWIPNLHAELVMLEKKELAVSLKVGGYYADVQTEDGAPGSLLAVPVSLFGSLELVPRWWLHGEGTYLVAEAFGTGNLDNLDIDGAVATRTAQLGAMLEWQLTRVVSLTALGRYQVYSGPLVFEGETSPDPSTTVNIEAQLNPRVENPWQAIGGAAFLWRHVRLVVGVGYGHYFVPGMGIAAPSRGFVPDASLAVVL